MSEEGNGRQPGLDPHDRALRPPQRRGRAHPDLIAGVRPIALSYFGSLPTQDRMRRWYSSVASCAARPRAQGTLAGASPDRTQEIETGPTADEPAASPIHGQVNGRA